MKAIKLINLIILLGVLRNTYATAPIVLWHGMGDTCCFSFSLGYIKKFLQTQLNQTYVTSIKIGGSMISDYSSGFFVHPNKQIQEACNIIQNDPQLSEGYNAIGFSQGGQFLRAVAQRCPNPPMKNLISIGGQHQGVFGLPSCPSLSSKTCEYFRKLLNHAAYAPKVQNWLVQATYWHDPLDEELYRKKSTFIAEINNELSINQSYIDNLSKLEKFVMVKFKDDTVVQPKESEWFEFYEPGNDKKILPLEQSEIYVNDRLGLQAMMVNDQLIFLESPGDHLQFKTSWFVEHIIPYLSGP